MEYEKILININNGLTGNSEKDVPYLKEQADTYKSHERSKDILRAIGRTLYDILPEDQKVPVASAFYKDSQRMDVLYDEARYLVSTKQYKKATVMMDSLIQLCEDFLEADKESDYFSFKNMYQAFVYQHFFNPTKNFKPTPYDFSDMYIIRGFLYMEERNMEASIQALIKAVRSNPVNIYAYFQLAEAYKLTGDFEEYHNLTRQALSFATTKAEIARCYRNIGFYFIEKENYPDAINMYYLSSDFDKNDAVTSELSFISQKTGDPIGPPDQEDILRTIGEQGIQVGASEPVLGIAAALGKKAYDDRQFDMARYCLGLVYDLTEDSEAKDLLVEIAQLN
ncbi:MAG: tetratricopeptide repeat protein [Desulfotomaculaceae bacterium]|nr:tetratricopeptide repeat protein [Desulfotomaculaceae bacterium]